MKKIIALVLIICCLGAVLCSCNKKLDLYEVYYLDDGESKTDSDYDIRIDDYNLPKSTYSATEKATLNKLTKPKKSITLGNETVPLEYVETYRKDFIDIKYDRFENDDYFMMVVYDENGEIDFLNLGEYKHQIVPTAINEQALIQASNDFLSNYIDLEGYIIEIVTIANYQKTEGFVAPVEGDAQVLYEVNYRNYIDGFMVGEQIGVTIDKDGFLKSAYFNMAGAFEEFENVDIDEEKYNELTSKEIRSICEIDNYELTGWSKSELLVIIDGKLCILAQVSPKYNSKDGKAEVYAEEFSLITPVAK